MSDIDGLLERRRLRRRVGFWRLAAFAVGGLAILGAGLYAAKDFEGPAGKAHIARVNISGMITGDTKTLDMLEKIGKSDAKALLVVIDSPGGTVTGSEAVYDALREVGKKKPVVALVDSMAASGGYITALGTERIYARETSLVGSIGVIMQYPNVTRLLEMVRKLWQTSLHIARLEHHHLMRQRPHDAQIVTDEQIGQPLLAHPLQRAVGTVVHMHQDLVRHRRVPAQAVDVPICSEISMVCGMACSRG